MSDENSSIPLPSESKKVEAPKSEPNFLKKFIYNKDEKGAKKWAYGLLITALVLFVSVVAFWFDRKDLQEEIVALKIENPELRKKQNFTNKNKYESFKNGDSLFAEGLWRTDLELEYEPDKLKEYTLGFDIVTRADELVRKSTITENVLKILNEKYPKATIELLSTKYYFYDDVKSAPHAFSYEYKISGISEEDGKYEYINGEWVDKETETTAPPATDVGTPPPSTAPLPRELKNGIKAKYYSIKQNGFESIPDKDEIVPNLNFGTNTPGGELPTQPDKWFIDAVWQNVYGPAGQKDMFKVIWKWVTKFEKAGEYKFKVRADDGYKIFAKKYDGDTTTDEMKATNMMDIYSDEGMTYVNKKTFASSAGQVNYSKLNVENAGDMYMFQIEYFELVETAYFDMVVKKPDATTYKELADTEFFYYDEMTITPLMGRLDLDEDKIVMFKKKVSPTTSSGICAISGDSLNLIFYGSVCSVNTDGTFNIELKGIVNPNMDVSCNGGIGQWYQTDSAPDWWKPTFLGSCGVAPSNEQYKDVKVSGLTMDELYHETGFAFDYKKLKLDDSNYVLGNIYYDFTTKKLMLILLGYNLGDKPYVVYKVPNTKTFEDFMTQVNTNRLVLYDADPAVAYSAANEKTTFTILSWDEGEGAATPVEATVEIKGDRFLITKPNDPKGLLPYIPYFNNQASTDGRMKAMYYEFPSKIMFKHYSNSAKNIISTSLGIRTDNSGTTKGYIFVNKQQYIQIELSNDTANPYYTAMNEAVKNFVEMLPEHPASPDTTITTTETTDPTTAPTEPTTPSASTVPVVRFLKFVSDTGFSMARARVYVNGINVAVDKIVTSNAGYGIYTSGNWTSPLEPTRIFLNLDEFNDKITGTDGQPYPPGYDFGSVEVKYTQEQVGTNGTDGTIMTRAEIIGGRKNHKPVYDPNGQYWAEIDLGQAYSLDSIGYIEICPRVDTNQAQLDKVKLKLYDTTKSTPIKEINLVDMAPANSSGTKTFNTITTFVKVYQSGTA